MRLVERLSTAWRVLMRPSPPLQATEDEPVVALGRDLAAARLELQETRDAQAVQIRDRPDVAAFQYHLESELLALREELRARTYQPGPYRAFHIRDPKPRLIDAAAYRDRVVHHALCQVIEPLFERTFVHVRSAIGNIPERPPAPDVTLGPVLTRWCERGRNSEFRGQSPEALRKTLRQAAPPEAMAALAALVANGQDIADDIEAARTHQHWLVRLACLALCDLAPQFAFSAIPAESDGGEMWIARLAPAILDATVYRRRAVSLNPDQLVALQVALTREKTNRHGGWAWGRLLEPLARYCLRDAIIVVEQRTVEVGDTEVEIEG